MARTKKRVLEDHRTTAQKSAAQKAAARMAASKCKAARILSTQELQDLPSQKHSDSDSDEDGSTYESFVQVCAACARTRVRAYRSWRTCTQGPRMSGRRTASTWW